LLSEFSHSFNDFGMRRPRTFCPAQFAFDFGVFVELGDVGESFGIVRGTIRTYVSNETCSAENACTTEDGIEKFSPLSDG
jgi:hypothetical protein